MAAAGAAAGHTVTDGAAAAGVRDAQKASGQGFNVHHLLIFAGELALRQLYCRIYARLLLASCLCVRAWR